MSPDRLGEAPTWEIVLPESDIDEFLKSLPHELLDNSGGRSVYINPGGAEVAEMFVSEGTSVPASHSTRPLPNLNTGTVKAENAGKLYILDFFSRKDSTGCSHGDRVLEVVSEVLRALGLGVLVPQVATIELDLYSNKAWVRQKIVEYAHTFAPDIEARLLAGLPGLIGKDSPNPMGYFTSLLYLQAVYSAATLKGKATVISSSFYAQPDAIGVLPYWLLPPDSPIIVTAVLDDAGAIESAAPVQPQRALWERRGEYPFVLSGAVDAGGLPFGMTSTSGNGVTVAHQGSGWGAAARCIRPATLGTSFSTPAVAAILFATREVLRQKGTIISNVQLRRRMTLTAMIDDQLVGKYASGGVPRPDFMVREGILGVLSDDTAVQVTSFAGSIAYQIAGERATSSFGVGLTNISGLAVSDTSAFVYIDHLGAWKRANIDSLSATLVMDGNSFSLKSLDDFRKYLKEVLIL